MESIAQREHKGEEADEQQEQTDDTFQRSKLEIT